MLLNNMILKARFLLGFLLCVITRIDAMANVVPIEKPKDTCAICLHKKPYDQNQWIGLKCPTITSNQQEHSFHKVCLMEVIKNAWQSKNAALCPIDRTKISEDCISKLNLRQEYLDFCARRDFITDWDGLRRLPPIKVAFGAVAICFGGWGIYDFIYATANSFLYPSVVSFALVLLLATAEDRVAEGQRDS